ncbi:MAG: hypothetical protein NTZ92_03235 [Candidatus Omnitrophica bacterium]|nr:hypothetical protein [Candidatus Omnitrophota bacterium]
MEAPSGHGARLWRAGEGLEMSAGAATLGHTKRPCEKQDKPTRHESREKQGKVGAKYNY